MVSFYSSPGRQYDDEEVVVCNVAAIKLVSLYPHGFLSNRAKIE